jgi:hypothetical protein
MNSFKAIQTGVRNTFGYVRSSPEIASLVEKFFSIKNFD